MAMIRKTAEAGVGRLPSLGAHIAFDEKYLSIFNDRRYKLNKSDNSGGMETRAKRKKFHSRQKKSTSKGCRWRVRFW
jgi:hypothetical protein